MGADPITLAAMAGTKTLGNWYGTRRQGQAIKKAGTTLANAANREAENAMQLPGYVNPAIADTYGRAGQDVYDQAWDNFSNVATTVDRATTGMNTAVGGANQRLDESLAGVQGYLDPYARGGQEAFQKLSDLANAKAPTLEELQMDPGYAFRLSEGQKALERSAATRGMLQSGSFAKDLANYTQGAASQEYANAFDRFMKLREGQRQSLTSLVGYGTQAADRAAGLTTDIGNAYGKNLLYGANQIGDWGMKGTEVGGGWLNDAARYKGNAQMSAIDRETGNIINSWNRASDLRMAADQATANSQYGLGNVWGNFYNNAGETAANTAYGLGRYYSGYGWGGRNPYGDNQTLPDNFDPYSVKVKGIDY